MRRVFNSRLVERHNAVLFANSGGCRLIDTEPLPLLWALGLYDFLASWWKAGRSVIFPLKVKAELKKP